MIELLRVDHRLLHGQIAYSWVNYLNANCILIANDNILSDELRKTTVKLAKPENTKLVIKGIEDSITAIKSGVTDKYKLLIVAENVADAVRLADACEQITKINLGNVKARKGAKQIGRIFNVTGEEERELYRLLDKGVKIGIQSVPEEKNVMFNKAI